MHNNLEPNPQQTAVYAWGLTGTGSLNLVARAGCGKTTTLVELVKYLKGRVFLGAFNKSIATELQARIGNRAGVVAGTMHSLGYYKWRKIVSKSRIESRKVRYIAKTYYPTNLPTHKACLQIVCDAVSYAKQGGFGLTDKLDFMSVNPWMETMEYHDLWQELPPSVEKSDIIRVCQEVFQTSLDQCINRKDSVIDFDDMIFAPLYFGWRVNGDHGGEYDWVLIDEAQDTNYIRRMLSQWVLKPGGRMVAVGDPAQAIYGFAGATNNAMDVIKKEMGSAELPLSVTYRCPKAVVELAQTWVPDITAHESAPDGKVINITHREFLRSYSDLRPTDVILCRNTRPLIGLAKRFRQLGVQCIVEGVNYRGLTSLVMKWGEDISIQLMLSNLSEYVSLECMDFRAKGKEDKAEQLQERLEMIRDFADDLDHGSPVYRLMDRIDKVLNNAESDDAEILRLCTIHRSKGREWDRVFLVGRNLYMPSKYATQEWQLEQEDNLAYVAVTRAKRALVEVECPVKKRGEPNWWED